MMTNDVVVVDHLGYPKSNFRFQISQSRISIWDIPSQIWCMVKFEIVAFQTQPYPKLKQLICFMVKFGTYISKPNHEPNLPRLIWNIG